MPMEIPGMGGNVGMINLSDMMGKAFGKQNLKRRKLKVPEAWDKLVDEEAEKRMDQDDVARVALPMPRPTASSSSTRSTRSRSATCAAVRSAAKACSAICCR
jgi:hypothetical protein